jgi:hypothetical protein
MRTQTNYLHAKIGDMLEEDYAQLLELTWVWKSGLSSLDLGESGKSGRWKLLFEVGDGCFYRFLSSTASLISTIITIKYPNLFLERLYLGLNFPAHLYGLHLPCFYRAQ